MDEVGGPTNLPEAPRRLRRVLPAELRAFRIAAFIHTSPRRTVVVVNQLPGRNDPCHCGSGLKYKKCHAERDREASHSPGLRLLAGVPEPARRQMLDLPPASQLNRAWELDIAPVPATFADDPAARPAAILVVAPPFVIGSEVVSRPSAEPVELAELLAHQVLDAVARHGAMPKHVSIRHAALIEPLGRFLVPHGIGVLLEGELPGVNEALQSLLAHVYGGIVPLHRLRAQPETWAGWGMPADLVARMFRAAAAYHRAAPWRISTDEIPVFVSRPGGHTWTAVVLGAAGNQTGLALYEDVADLERMYNRDDDPAAGFDGMKSTILSLLFNTRAELPRPMRTEVRDAGWDIAGANAYPTLMVLNTPGGGIRQQHFEDLAAALESIPKFVVRFEALLTGAAQDPPHPEWTDPDNGTTCRMDLEGAVFPGFMPPPKVLSPSGAQGPGATPLAALDERSAAPSVSRTLTRYRAWLRKPARRKPPSEATVRMHADTARLFAELCANASLKPVTAVNEYDLREFLYDWYPRKVGASEKEARSMLVSLRKFFEFLEEREGVICPWAGPILADADSFVMRWASFPGGFFWDERVQAWQAPHTRDLAARILLPVSDTRGGILWGDTMGRVEYTLNREAHRLWLAWRDEAVRAGTSAPDQVLELALARQRAWANAANQICSGLTPKEAIARERRESAAR